jgi:copper(I)-binding protein
MSHLTKSSLALALSLGLALTAAAAPAAMARTVHHAGYDAQASGEPDGYGGVLVSNHRAEALRTCNAVANRFPQQTYGDWQGDVYRACMTQHGEME